MAAPAEPMEDDMAEMAKRRNPNSTIQSSKQQDRAIIFMNTTKTERVTLEEAYPIGNYPALDPNKRIYHDTKTGFYFKLNSTRMGIWASAMAQKNTDEKQPPFDSRFFDAAQRMENVSNVPANVAVAPPAFPAAVGPALLAVSLSDVFMASILSQSNHCVQAPRRHISVYLRLPPSTLCLPG
ncbi:hypothetical protein B0H14DRAFT_3468411 [Mycena olivaceomarginata]|nr:hypothetical protein B0H14DRAFT_3468411 [Mycena olivaceomarginata]